MNLRSFDQVNPKILKTFLFIQHPTCSWLQKNSCVRFRWNCEGGVPDIGSWQSLSGHINITTPTELIIIIIAFDNHHHTIFFNKAQLTNNPVGQQSGEIKSSRHPKNYPNNWDKTYDLEVNADFILYMLYIIYWIIYSHDSIWCWQQTLKDLLLQQVTSGSAIELTFESFDLERPHSTRGCIWDWVEVKYLIVMIFQQGETTS